VSMTNVHAMIHKPTDEERISQPGLTVELCIHGGGVEEYGRGLTVVDDTLPAVQQLKLLLAENARDSDASDVESSDSEYATAVASDTGQLTYESIPRRGPVIGVLGSRNLSSGCLKHLAESIPSPVKKAESPSDTDAGAGSNQPIASDDVVIVASQSSSAEIIEDRCLLSTSTG